METFTIIVIDTWIIYKKWITRRMYLFITRPAPAVIGAAVKENNDDDTDTAAEVTQTTVLLSFINTLLFAQTYFIFCLRRKKWPVAWNQLKQLDPSKRQAVRVRSRLRTIMNQSRGNRRNLSTGKFHLTRRLLILTRHLEGPPRQEVVI